MEVIDEAAQFFRLLFTPCALYMDEDEARSKKYIENVQKMETLDEKQKSKHDTRVSKTWDTFDNPKGEPEWQLVCWELINKLDELNGQWLKDDGLRVFEKGASSDYWKGVRGLLRLYVVNGSREEEDEKIVANNILSKVRWYEREAACNDRLVVPILTPKLLDALAANIGARARAYEEVSDYNSLPGYYIFLGQDFFFLPARSNMS